MYRSNIYPKMILLVSFFVLALNSVFAQPSMEFKLQLIGPNQWGVYVRPNGVTPTTNSTITASGQVTVVMPANYAWNTLASVSGTWTNNATVHGPTENTARSYISFGFLAESPAIVYAAGTETLLFTFKGNGICPDSLYLIDNNTDPFNVLPNSVNSNPGNEITVFDAGLITYYEWMGNYSPSAWSCEDCDGDGVLNAYEDTDGDGVYDNQNEDFNGNGILDPGEDLDGDLYLDPDVSQICNPCDPYHTESASLELLDSLGVICANDLGDTACFRVVIDGHWPPYTVNWTDGVDTFATTNIYNGDTICYVPTASVSLELLSIIDSFNCVLDTALGTPIDIEVHGPIVVDVHPQDTTECSGNAAGFCITASNTGDGAIIYKWQVSTNNGVTWTDINDGGVYDDTDSTCMEITNVVGKHGYQFRCAISTTVCDRVFSNAGTLSVEGPVSISTHPSNITNCDSETASFTSIAVNSGAVGTLGYIWQVNDGSGWQNVVAQGGATYGGVNATTINLSNIDILMDGWQYRLSVTTGECSVVYSNPATLDIEGPITITDDPDDFSNCAGNAVYFTSTFSNPGNGTTTAQWQVADSALGPWANIGNGGVYTGAQEINLGTSGVDSLTISDVTGLNGKWYRVIYTSPTCSVPINSAAAQLQVSGNVTYSNSPDDITTCSGGDTIFVACASIPQGDFTWGWQYSDDLGVTWTDITLGVAPFTHSTSGAISTGCDTLRISNVAGMYNRRFRAVANATDCNSIYSDDATLTVQGPLAVTDQPDPVVECSGNNTTFSATISNGGGLTSTIYRWQISLDGGVTWINLSNNSIYNGTNTGNNTTGTSILSISNVAGLHGFCYRLAYSTGTCNIQFTNMACLTVEGPITVSAQPVDVDLCSGDAASFTSTATVGTAGTFAYQWQVSSDNLNFTDIDGSTDGGVYSGFNTTTLNVSNSTGLYSRCYRLAFSTGECNRVFSNRACLNVDGPIYFTDHPDDIIQCSGEAVLFCATTATDSEEADSLTQIQYNWQENTGTGWVDLVDDTLYNGVLTSCLSVAYTTNLDGNTYRLKIWTDNCDTVYSNAATVVVEGPMIVTDEPDNITECSGSGVSFSSTVALMNGDANTLIYQWEYSSNSGTTWNNMVNDANISGATTTTVSIADVAGMYGWRFRMRYRTPNCSAAWSNYAVLTVEGPISVTNHPDHIVECSGNPVNFAILTSNTGQGAITYQWQVCISSDSLAGPWINLPSNSTYNGTTTANLSIANVAGFNGYYYRALIQTSTCSSVISYAAVLQVEGPISFTDHPDDITQCSGESVTFTGAAGIAPGNVGTLVYQWQWSSDCVNYSDIVAAGANAFSGYNTPVLTVGNVVGINGRCFRLTVRTAECNRVNSQPAKLTVEGPLTITVNPTDFTNCSDKEAYFYSGINNPGQGEVFQQWQYSPDGGTTWNDIVQFTDTLGGGQIVNFGGYDSDTLLITPLDGLNGYLFRNVFWTATCNRDTSSQALLTVEGPISFTDQPDDVTLCAAQSTCFTIAIANSTGAGVIQYQWQRWTAGGWLNLSNSAPYSGAYTNQLCINPVDGLYNAKYRCRVKTGNCEWEDSDQANLFIEGPITFNLQPVDASVCSNKQHIFNTTITNPGYGQMTYRWQYKSPSGGWGQFASNTGALSSIGVTNPTDPGAQWSGAYGQDLVLTNTDGLNGYQFRLNVIMPHCGDTTNTVTLTVRDKCLAGDCDLDNDGTINSLDADDDNDQLSDYWEAWMTTNNVQVATDTFIGTGPWWYTVSGAAFPASPYITYNRCLVDTDGDGLYDNQEDPDEDNIQNGEETDGDGTFDGNPLDPCNPVLGPTCIGINLAIKVRLQGAKLSPAPTDNFMRATLRAYGNPAQRLVPTQEPYEDMQAFAHNGPDGGGDEIITDSTTIFGVADSNAVVDWVFVELRSATALDSVATTRAGLLQRDGDVVDVDGTSNLRFPSAAAGTYYVAVRHRNHLGIMTGEALDLSPALQEIDFTDPSFVVNGLYPQINIGGKMYMWAGDLSSDGRVIYQGPGNDILKLFTTVLYNPENTTLIANYISEGYQVADVNLDGRAIYQGPLNDRSMLLLNTILKHPANGTLISNFVILEQLP